jgi:hypothetical protein
MDPNLLWLLFEVNTVPGVEKAPLSGVKIGSGRGLPTMDGDISLC